MLEASHTAELCGHTPLMNKPAFRIEEEQNKQKFGVTLTDRRGGTTSPFLLDYFHPNSILFFITENQGAP